MARNGSFGTLWRLVSMLGLISTTGAWGAGEASSAQGCSRPIRVAASADGRFMIIERGGVVSGADHDLLELVGKRIGCQFIYEIVSRARAVVMLQDASIDIFPLATRTSGRDALATFVHTASFRPMLLVMGRRPAPIHSMTDLVLGDLRLDIVRAFDYGPVYQALVTNPAMRRRITENVDVAAVAKRLANGQSDCTLMVPATFAIAAETAGIADRIQVVALDELPLTDAGEYIVERALPAADAALLEQAIADAVRNGEYETLIRTQFDHPSWAAAGYEPEPDRGP